ncbi:MAG: RNA methyltransferase, partial [Eubacterium sp.]|nr:RNA methyltransferase [Eubacterium sp.]
VQKAVELGVYEIIPVRTARCVVRLDEAKSSKKKERWQRIAEGAAKQSGRGIVPEVFSVMNMDDAIAHAASSDIILIPYELCEDHQTIEELRLSVGRGSASIAVFIGPEGGFETGEVDAVANAGGRVISLGHRILRTETAAIAVLANLMFMIEEAASKTVNGNEQKADNTGV